MRIAPYPGSGIHYWCNYGLKNGDVQALSRFNMYEQKLTVSRVQCTVQVHDGVATLTSCGRSPTLWRGRDVPNWVALGEGDQVPVSDGDQISLDCNDPESAVFLCQEESVLHHRSDGHLPQDHHHHFHGGHQHQQQLPYPWEQAMDQTSGALYYYNTQTGEASWEPPHEQGGGYEQQQQQQHEYGQQQQSSYDYSQHYAQQGGGGYQGGY